MFADAVDFFENWEQRLADADGDVIEALHGHKCGPDCWHKWRPKPITEDEIKADIKGASRRAARDAGTETRRELIRAAARFVRERFL